MVPIIPKQRQHPTKASKPFDDLVAYIEGEKEKEKERGPEQENAPQGELFTDPLQRTQPGEFDDLIDYATAKLDPSTQGEKCVAIRTHGVNDISTASAEMNAVSLKNTRCTDPAYHFILSWPEHERPAPEKMFDAAEHALKALGLAEHQYVLAVHGNTDNDHCHISVNRIHPVTFKSRHIEWAAKTLHMAARESEIKHGWTHDNGIYIVKKDGHGKKSIILNMEHAEAVPRATGNTGKGVSTEKILPAWHDPDSFESWLKTKVEKALKRDLPHLDGWPGLHAWLERHDITLANTGGGGMRLQATSSETGEVLDIAASKGLRILKRGDLEKRWGKFVNSAAIPSTVPNTAHLTPIQLNEGIEHVISQTPGKPPSHVLARSGIGLPPEHVMGAEQSTGGNAPEGAGSLHELPGSELDVGGQNGQGVLPNALHGRLGDNETGQDHSVRRSGAGQAGSGSKSERGLARDDSKRAERKEQRAAGRADLRQRFSQYKRFVAIGDTAHFVRLKDATAERSRALKEINTESKTAKAAIPKGTSVQVRLISTVAIDAECLRRKLQVESAFQDNSKSLLATRTPPLSWRAWLYEQANLSDQAALSALRGIVYQAQRDAKKDSEIDPDEIEIEAADTEAYREQQYRKVMERLIKEEKEEVAIRSAKRTAMRPFEVDALLARYMGIQYRVTGNGNIEYSDQGGDHLFTDRGNRVTFDRVRVSDEEICLALVHAQQKFGKALTLTGDDRDFTARMARLADDMGIAILNPEMRVVIERHRADRIQETANEAAAAIAAGTARVSTSNKPAQREPLPQTQAPITSAPGEAPPELPIPQERLRAIVLSIDPHAQFVLPDPSSIEHHAGPLAATIGDTETAPGYAQHTGRNQYTLHAGTAPQHDAGAIFEVRYANGFAVATLAPAAAQPPAQRPSKPAEKTAVVAEADAGLSQHSLTMEFVPLTAHAWLANWAAQERKSMNTATAETGATAHTVVYVGPDGIVVNRGRSGAVYPIPSDLTVHVGDKVAVDKNGELRAPRTPEKGGGKSKVGR